MRRFSTKKFTVGEAVDHLLVQRAELGQHHALGRVLQGQSVLGHVAFDESRNLARPDADPLLVQHMLQFDGVQLAVLVIGLEHRVRQRVGGLNLQNFR